MTLDGHVVSTGADGRLVGMGPADVAAMVSTALAQPRVVMHFHGGLVNEAGGRAVAESLLPVYTAAGAYPLFFQWRAGAIEIVQNNIGEIAREDIFERLVRHVLSWTVGAVRAESGGARGGCGAMRPADEELRTELAARKRTTDPDQGTEPFAGEAVPASGLDEHAALTPAEEAAFRTEVQTDPRLRILLAGAIADRGLKWVGASGGRGVPDVSPTSSMIDDEVLTEIAAGDVDGARGMVSTLALAHKALQVLRAVLSRYRSQTDSGIYPTVVEEILRAFYLANVGGALWAAMKKETLDTFAPSTTDRGGRLVLDGLGRGLAAGDSARITLVGHSTGAVFIDNLLRSVSGGEGVMWPGGSAFQVCFLAPACTTQHFAGTLDSAAGLIERFRMFTMADEAERKDRLVGAVYPRSLLYLVSGLLERDRDVSMVAPLVGLARYLAPSGLDQLLTSELCQTARLDTVRTFCTVKDRVVLSPTADGTVRGSSSSALHHGDFDDDALVRQSLTAMIQSW